MLVMQWAFTARLQGNQNTGKWVAQLKNKTWIIGLLFAKICYAQNSISIQPIPDSQITSKAQTKQAPFDISLLSSHDTYLNSDAVYFAPELKSSQISTFGMGIKSTKTFNWIVDADVFASVQEDEFYWNLREAYQTKSRGKTQISWGRKLQTWSATDEFWQLGVWQPRFTWDEVHTHQNGLTGYFWQRKANAKNDFTFFVSPIFLPEFGQNYKEQNGQIVSANPWFSPPPKSLSLFGQVNPIWLSVDEPTAQDVVFKPSAAIAWDFETQYQKTHLAYAYKPMNQPYTSIDYFYRMVENRGAAIVTIHPSFPYEHVATLEETVGNDNHQATVGVTFQKPEITRAPTTEISRNQPEQWTSTIVYTGQIYQSARRKITIGAGYIHVDGGIGPDLGENAGANSLYELRPRWLDATHVRLAHQTFGRVTRSDYFEAFYDEKQNGGLVSLGSEFQKNNVWKLGLRADWIGLLTEKNLGLYESSFVSTYRANDRIQVDAKYVF
jgi:hypothetical protein